MTLHGTEKIGLVTLPQGRQMGAQAITGSNTELLNFAHKDIIRSFVLVLFDRFRWSDCI